MTSKTVVVGEMTIEVFRATLRSSLVEDALVVRLNEAYGAATELVERMARGTFVFAASSSKVQGGGDLDLLANAETLSVEEVKRAYAAFNNLDKRIWRVWVAALNEVNAEVNPTHLTPEGAKKKTSPTKSATNE